MSGRGPVLVVDDDFDVREALLDVLADCGYDVRAAGDGVEALALLEAGLVPSVILLDLMMPRMDGVELRGKLLEREAYAALPVVLLTADRSSDERAGLPVDGTLAKPVDLDQLLDVISRYC